MINNNKKPRSESDSQPTPNFMREDRTEMSEDDDRSPPPPPPHPPSSDSGSGSGPSSVPDYQAPYPDQVLENVLENVLCFLTSRRDRNAASLVCKSWYRVEALTRSELFIGNCYAVSTRRATCRFTRIKSVTLKGKPRFADFNLMPPNWGAHFAPWVTTMGKAYPWLEKVHLKRMTVTDDDLALLAESFSGFKELVLVCCDGFGTSGLAIVASRCRQLRVLDLIESEVADDEVDWISCFPESEMCLESLIFDCVECSINFDALERLVARSPSLKKIRLNRYVSVSQLYRLMIRAPQLTHLGTGSFRPSDDAAAQGEQEPDYASAFAACKSLVCLSGFKEILSDYLPAIYPVCANLNSLNLSYANITADQLKPIISNCHKLQTFWVLDSICDEGLQAVAATCKELRELRVFPIDAREDSEGPVSEVGLQAISEGCRKLQSILYFCQHMTNAAVIAMSKNCPDLVVFRLCIMGRHRPDRVTGEPMDEGFGAIVMNCKKLSRLAVSGLLTDRAFSYIGEYGKTVRTLSVAFAGDSDMGLKYLLEGCPKLQKLEIRDSPFGDGALLSGLHHYYNMRFLWMSACKLTRNGCQQIARELPGLVVEVINHEYDEDMENFVDTLYMYRSLEGPRDDAPKFVSIL
ncbi:transport inhibitor response 1-like protein [Ricinus communis]|uniref:TRANSPORT INHIBITOR RESPONSE 1 protein, putative n=1 Tax=Ricinus communis TaxID=3988 RepID=B9RJT7_RICCO|nr:transport inhibitor response 1-like protein [Ricinus communis]EEF48589.1 TRANSPORT INHIBITOR RESPONSE 1 protein, putative [Ricinus communis]|eukprot:XP_002514006.1 transport inhibitor response 1-like protein [Ricinus communis]